MFGEMSLLGVVTASVIADDQFVELYQSLIVFAYRG